jgi:polysaccharide chain length determinant protein (PEP-CTERM system associated)
VIPGKTYGIEDIVAVLKRRRWVILAPFVLVSLATLAVVRVLPNKYRAETVILVVPQRVPESYVRSTVTAPIEDRLRSISEQILSRSRLEQIILDLNLYPTLRRTTIMEDIVARMRREIDVEVIKGDAFRVSFVGDDPRTVAQVAQRLASLFIEENLKDREVLAEGSFEFIDSQLEEARGQLLEREKQLEEYSRRYDGQLPTQLQGNLQMMSNLQSQIRAIDESIARDRDQRLIIERSIADATAIDAPDPSQPRDAAPTTAAQRLAIAQEQFRLLQTRLAPKHPDVIAAKRALERLAQEAEAEQMQAAVSPAGPSPAMTAQERAKANKINELRQQMANLDQRIEGERAQEQQLRETLSVYQARVEATPTRSTELTDLTRDYDTLNQQYRNLLAKKYDSKVAANLEKRQIGEQFKVLDPAKVPEKPYSPDRTRLTQLGVAFGLCLGLGLAALLEYLDTTLKTDDDVFVALSLPVLAVVPKIEAHARPRRRRMAWPSVARSAAVIAAAAAAVGLWVIGS